MKKPTSRLWPQTEALKAALAQLEASGAHPARRAPLFARNIFDRYLAPDGLWSEQLSPDGESIVEFSPASSFYHIFCAFAELIRVSGEGGALPLRASPAIG